MRKALLLLSISLAFVQIDAQDLHVGDPGVTFDQSLIDTNMYTWPQIQRWSEAGVRGGIPFIEDLEQGAAVTIKTSDGINAAIKSAPAGSYVYLPDGEYIISTQVSMRSDIYLLGESREGVLCTITKKDGIAFAFEDVQRSGIFNLTIQGDWGIPEYPWNIGEEANKERPDITNVSVWMRNGTSDCFLDEVSILNSGLHPMRCFATHNTFRNLVVDGCHNKGGGAQGYFFIQHSDNLVTGCFITHLRHISLQGDNVEYNVVYKNKFYQEVSFHSGDNGNNLIEQNEITLPADMWPGYYAIMGPWSIQHELSHHFNLLYRNECLELSQGHNSATPWDKDTVVYQGPYEIRPIGAEAIYNNFRNSELGNPLGGTLYPVNNVVYDEILVPNFPPLLNFILPDQRIFNKGESVSVELDASDDDTLVSVSLFLNEVAIGAKSVAPFRWGESEAELQNMQVGNYILKAIAEDNKGKTTEKTISFEVVDPSEIREYVETFTNMSLDGWGSESYAGDYGFTWNVSAKGISGDIDSKGIYFHGGKVGVTSGPIPGGIAKFSMKCLDKWSEGNVRIIELLINDSIAGTKTHTGFEQYTFSVDSINVPGEFTLAIRNASASDENNTLSIDDISWFTYTPDTTVVTSLNEKFDTDEGLLLYPNPAANLLHIRSNTMLKSVEIVNLTGSIVHRENLHGTQHSMEVDLPEGLYLVHIEGEHYRASRILTIK